MCWRMIMDGLMSQEDEETFRDIDRWFRENLPEPEAAQLSYNTMRRAAEEIGL